MDAAASCGFSTYSAGVSACVKWLHPRSPVSTLVHNARNTRTSPGAQRAKHQKASAPANVHQAGGERVPLCAAHNRKKTDHSAKVESRRFLLNALINTMQIVPPDHFFCKLFYHINDFILTILPGCTSGKKSLSQNALKAPAKDSFLMGTEHLTPSKEGIHP